MTLFVMDTFSYLGIDWGERKVGIALADSETLVSMALVTLQNDRYLLESLARIIGDRNVRVIVIGIPSHVNRERVVYGGEELGLVLAKRFRVQIYYQDEMFTTKLARMALLEKGVRRDLDALDDQEAARIILGDFLARQGKV